ncbi:MAG: glycosyltransferase family 4 protein, partial [Candidatus Nanopelagicales bacterium]|nr:glycosyltransferase family 4 protein [Candidatus Nanopelagicales bacterium]
MNILLISDMAHTGFGRVGRELGLGLLNKGHDIRIIGINYRGIDGELSPIIGQHLVSDDLMDSVSERFEELRNDPLTARTIPASTSLSNGQSHSHGHHLTVPAIHGQVWQGWHADATILVSDAEAVRLRLLDTGTAIAAKPVYNYVPIEGTGIARSYELVWKYTNPIAMSRFGQTQLEALLNRPVPMIPHGASGSFHPVSPTDPGRFRGKTISTKEAAKAAFDLSGKTVVLRVDRHIYRKNYAAFFRVMRPILQQRPDVVCVIHCRPQDEYGNLYDLISREPGAVNHDPNSIFGWSHPQYILTSAHDSWRGLSDDDLNVLYNAADLLVSPTMAEGFGLTLLEALACGVPVVSTDYSAITEVVGPGGIVVKPSAFLTNIYAHEWALVDEPAMSEAVLRLIEKPALRRELGRLGRKHAASYTWTAAVDQFDALLTSQPAAAAA